MGHKGRISVGVLASVISVFVSTACAEEKDLLGWWRLDEGAGQVAIDGSGHAHNGRLAVVEWAPAQPAGSVLEFDGLKAHVNVPHADELNLAHELTAMAWLFPVDLAGQGAVLVKGRDNPASGYMFFREGAELRFVVATERTPGEGVGLGVGYGVLRSGPILGAGRWQHVAAVYSVSRNKAVLYLNGQKVREAPADGRIVYRESKLPLNLGAMSYPGYWNLRGFLRDVRLYSTALDDNRINTHYQQSRKAVEQLAVLPKEQRQAQSFPARIVASLVDKQTGKPLHAKVFVKDGSGKYYWPQDSFAYGLGGPKQCFYASGSFELPVPTGKFEISATAGFEYLPLNSTVEVKAAGPQIVQLALERFVDMPSKGWYAGEHHLHPTGHGGRRYDGRMTLANAGAICQAEGMDFAFWMGSRGHEVVATDELTESWKLGQIYATEGFVAQCCIEPTGICGHRCVVGAPYWSIKGNPQFQALPIFDQVNRHGGLCIFSHPYAGGLPLERDSSFCFARELPVAVALRRATMWDLLCWGGSQEEKLRDWYRWLNLGFRLCAGGSTDCYMNNPTALISPGANRTYAKTSRLAIPDLVQAYRQGRTVVTNGPLLLLTVNGREVGDLIQLQGDKPRRLPVRIEAHHAPGVDRVELIRNGQIAATLAGKGRPHVETTLDLDVSETCWLAARCIGKQGACFGTFAHTSPIYVQFGSTPLKARPDDVEFFLQWLEGYRNVVKEFAQRNRIPDEEYRELLVHIDDAANVYRGLIASPQRWTPGDEVGPQER